MESIGVESFKGLYVEDEEFYEIYKVCLEFNNNFHNQYSNFTLQNGLFSRGNQLYVPRGSTRENLIQERHNGSLNGYFGVNKTIEIVERFYYWHRM